MPQAARTFRIFVSSTFNDLKAERNALQERVYPRLKELCESRGTHFQAIDLRWGVSAEAARDQQTVNICLTEVDRCRETSPKPNFIILLGDRYGWRPPPPQIPAAEFAAIRDRVSDDRALLEEWYLEDENADPSEYVLKEREGQYEDDETWSGVERRLVAALRSGLEEVSLSEEARSKYVDSATEQEIERGALGVKDAPEHVFCFFREITNLEDLVADIPEEKPEWDPQDPERVLAEDFIDLINPKTDRRPESDAAARLSDLKARLREHPGNVEDYRARWTGDAISLDHIDQLCADVYEHLSRVILEELEGLGEEGTLEREIDSHRKFAAGRARFFTGRRETLDKIAAYVGDGDRHPLALHGISGSGKSAVIAMAAQEAAEKHPDAAVVVRFIGATPESSDARNLLTSLCQQIARRYGAAEATPADYRELVEEFPNRLALATAERPLILFLDALDQLSDAEGARSLVWLPAELPEDAEHVRVVVSTLRADPDSDEEAPVGSECLAALAAKLPPGSLVELPPMTKDQGAELLDSWLSQAGRPLAEPEGNGEPAERAERRFGARKLTEDQRKEVLAKFEHEKAPKGLPLYLKLAFEEARRWRSFTPAAQTKLTPGIPGIIRENLFARLKKPENHGKLIVERSLAYLGAAKNGLSEDELLDVLSSEELIEDFQQRAPRSPKVDHLPVVVWSRLYYDLEPYLGERSADNASLMGFYHRQLREVVEKDYLAGDDGRDRHRELARYFADDAAQPLERRSNGDLKANLRRLSEVPFQQSWGELWDEVFDTLTDFHFLEVKAANSGVVEATDDQGNKIHTYTGAYLLQDDYALALEHMPGGGGGRGPRRAIIVTATDFGEGYVVRCPHCNAVHTFERECPHCTTTHRLEDWKGTELQCPNESCGGPLKVNEFVVPPRP